MGDGIELVVCGGCQRHVKTAAVASGLPCPFCGEVPSSEAAQAAASFARPMLPRDRSVLLFGAAAVAGALAISGCSKEGSSDSGGSGVVMPYGVPIPPPVPDAGVAPPPSPADAGAPEPKKDAGTTSTPPMPVAPAYGAPPVMKKQ